MKTSYNKLKTELEVSGVIVLNLCNHCRMIAEGDEDGWAEGMVEGGLNEYERNKCIDFLCENYGEENRKIFKDGEEGGMQIWDVCYNICPECSGTGKGVGK